MSSREYDSDALPSAYPWAVDLLKTNADRSLLSAHNVYEEIVLSYSLLFSRDEKSRNIARKLFSACNAKVTFIGTEFPRLDRKVVIITDWTIYHFGQTPMLSHFEHYRGHFAFLQKQMQEWKPHTIKDLLQPGYKDRFTWYASML